MAEIQTVESTAPLIDDAELRGWMVAEGLAATPLPRVFQGFCERLCAGGFPMSRAYMGLRTLHPTIGAYGFLWQRGRQEVTRIDYEHAARALQPYQASPIHHMEKTGEYTLRRNLEGDPAGFDFPILHDLRKEGFTDYAATIVPFGGPEAAVEGRGIFFTCATRRPGGFNDDELRHVLSLLPELALALKARATYDVAAGVLETYLGRDAGRRVLRGQIRRGSGETIRAVLWNCDLRDFTPLAESVSREELVSVLNDYLECLAGPVHNHGGQILKFLGDGFLATFELDGESREDICRTALAAARTSCAAVDRLNHEREEAGKPVLGFGLALHVGEVLYGNIGANDRLDFTVVGPAVNEVSRIQELCRVLSTDLLISRTFYDVACDCQGRLTSCGYHELRGIRGTQEIFTLAT